jgi:hypothetical protein
VTLLLEEAIEKVVLTNDVNGTMKKGGRTDGEPGQGPAPGCSILVSRRFRARLQAVDDYYAWVKAQTNDTLRESLDAELPEHVKKHYLSLDARCELLERVKAALPEDMRRVL